MNYERKVGVVGGGISGIAAAYFLEKKGFKVEIINADKELGGRAGSDYIGTRKIGFGGKNIGRNYPLFRQFVADHGDFEYEYFGINTSSKIKGKSHVIDTTKPISALKNMVALTGVKDFLRILPMMAVIKLNENNGYLGGPYFNHLAGDNEDKTMDEFFCEKCTNNFVRPITIRMNGSEPENYYLGNFGSNLKMIMDKYDQLVDGVHAVIEKLSPNISIKNSTQVTGLMQQGNRIVGIMATQEDGTPVSLNYDAVIIATPAPYAAKILEEANSELSFKLKQVKYNPVAIAVAKYRKNIFGNNVRARVFGTEHCLSNAGAYGINDLDMVRYTFSGSLTNQTIHENTDPEEILAMGEASLNSHFSVDKKDRENYVYRYFKYGYCAYSPNHNNLIQRVKEITRQSFSGLFLTGDYIRGAALEACFRASYEVVQSFEEEIKQSELRNAV
ncbi:FAD-dependent oxidoreductase [Aliikangiella sp. IMCC44359]|uniref:FAD-dependent oxidoreductase n=1 Tax=Aliikangiella sp. IMCC44359 TaxID=3459125 RepID=UPI00403B12E6